MSTIKAIAQTSKGCTAVLKLIDIPKPTLTPHDLLVRIKAVSLNPVDTQIRSGAMDLGLPQVLGYDASGIVEEVGANVKLFKKGDSVIYAGALGRQGTNAELAVVDERIVGKKPSTLSWEDAAAYPLVSLTAWEALVEHFNIPINPTSANPSTILIINGAGGVGSIATQLSSKVLKLSNIIVTASRPETISWAKSQGATHVITHYEPLKPQIDALGLKVDYALITHSTEKYTPELIEILQPLGKIASIVHVDQPLPFYKDALTKSLSFHWVLMFTKSYYGVQLESQGQILNSVADLLDQGVLSNLATERHELTLENLKKAHEKVESGKGFGKIVLKMPEAGLRD